MATVLDGASLTVTTATDCPNDAGLLRRVSRTAAVSPPTSAATTFGLEPPYCRDKYRAYSLKPSIRSTWTFFLLLASLYRSTSSSYPPLSPRFCRSSTGERVHAYRKMKIEIADGTVRRTDHG